MSQIIRCFGKGDSDDLLTLYHDTEWGVPVYDEACLFEYLILEGAQAGLSWDIVLKKREGYRKAFYHFDIARIATMSDEELDRLQSDSRIVRNRLKIKSVRTNARVALDIIQYHGSLRSYFWDYVNNVPIQNHPQTLNDVATRTDLSDAISADLKAKGMNFVGSTILYAFMQAVGMVDDHLTSCWCYQRDQHYQTKQRIHSNMDQ